MLLISIYIYIFFHFTRPIALCSPLLLSNSFSTYKTHYPKFLAQAKKIKNKNGKTHIQLPHQMMTHFSISHKNPTFLLAQARTFLAQIPMSVHEVVFAMRTVFFFFFFLLFSNYLLQIFWLVEVLSFFVRAYLVVNWFVVFFWLLYTFFLFRFCEFVHWLCCDFFYLWSVILLSYVQRFFHCDSLVLFGCCEDTNVYETNKWKKRKKVSKNWLIGAFNLLVSGSHLFEQKRKSEAKIILLYNWEFTRCTFVKIQTKHVVFFLEMNWKIAFLSSPNTTLAGCVNSV